MGITLMIHSILRWVIVAVGAVAIIKFALGWLRGGRFSGMDRGLSSGFSGLIDLQVLLGVVLLVWAGLAGEGFPAYRLVHGAAMIVAAAAAHLPGRWKQAADEVRFRNSLLAVIAALVIIYLGVALLPGGWSR